MGYHVYKASWTPMGEELYSVMESTNLRDKYIVTVQRNDGNVVGHLLTGRVRKICKDSILFLKSRQKKHSYRITVLGKAVNVSKEKLIMLL